MTKLTENCESTQNISGESGESIFSFFFFSEDSNEGGIRTVNTSCLLKKHCTG